MIHSSQSKVFPVRAVVRICARVKKSVKPLLTMVVTSFNHKQFSHLSFSANFFETKGTRSTIFPPSGYGVNASKLLRSSEEEPHQSMGVEWKSAVLGANKIPDGTALTAITVKTVDERTLFSTVS